MPDNINELNSQILDALQGDYSPPQGNIQEPKSPILQAILDGGGGGTPPDYEQLKNQVYKNTNNIQRIADAMGIDLSIEYRDIEQNQGVALNQDGIGIDTGLKLNGNAIFRFIGCLKNKENQVCVIGARTGTSTSERTCINFLPKSGQIQSQWAANKYKTDNIEMTQPFDIVADKNQTIITQSGGVYIVIENSGFDGVNDTTPICLFNQSLNNTQYYSPIIQRVEIDIDGVNNVFKPMIKSKNGVDFGVVLMKNSEEMTLPSGVALDLITIQAA